MRNFSNRWQLFFAGSLVLLFALLMFRGLLAPGMALLTTDDNLALNSMQNRTLPMSMLAGWLDFTLAGFAAFVPASLTMGCLSLAPPLFYTNWIHAGCLAGASFFLMLALRQAGLRWTPCLLAALTAFWLASNFTLTYAGHNSKFAILFFAAMYLWIMGRLPAVSRQASGLLLAGGVLGMMINEQADVGLFFAMILGPYALFVLWFKCGLRGWRFIRLVGILLVPAFLIALRPALEGYRVSVKDVAAVSDESPAAQWDFVTQWSWPPEETIDFIAPGYTGWRSGEPAGPYWGRMGRSAGWEQTKQGFQNFKLENVYLGAIPVALACFALLGAVMAWRRRTGDASGWPPPQAAGEVWFWSAAALLTLLLAFGKNFPLYYLFYQLPMVGNIRNPNKFLQIFQLALAILAAYGLDMALRGAKTSTSSAPK